MQNLALVGLEEISLFVEGADTPDNTPWLDEDRIIYVGEEKYLSKFCLLTKTHSLRVKLPGKYQCVFGINYFVDEDAIFFACDDYLVFYHLNEFTEYPIDIERHGSLMSAAWNHSKSLLLCVHKNSTLTTYRKIVTEDGGLWLALVNIGFLDAVVPDSVYVGWGDRDTQFQGHKLKKKINPEISLSPLPAVISWSVQKDLVVINFWKDSRRFLQVFTYDLSPLFKSEPYNNLLHATSFRPQGNFIACSSHDGDTNCIVVFEKNCLVKGEFRAPDCHGLIIQVECHPERNILAAISQSMEFNYLNIYMFSNNKWFLKFQHLFLSDTERVLHFTWENSSNELLLLNLVTTCAFYKFIFKLIHQAVDGLVPVIDGSEVTITDFNQEMMPPPCGSHTFGFDTPVTEIFYDRKIHVFGFEVASHETLYYKYNEGQFFEEDIQKYIMTDFRFIDNNKYTVLIDHEDIDIFLDDNLHLSVDKGKVSFDNVSSVYVHKLYLLFTHFLGNEHILSGFRLTKENIINFDDSILCCRAIESGAKIVTVNRRDEIILELPRGNVETVVFRLMSLDTIDELLSKNNWEEAILQVKFKRIDCNVLIDLNPERFTNKVKDFIIATKTTGNLNNILTEFNLKDCIKSKFSFWLKQKELQNVNTSDISKEQVIMRILDTLIELGPIKHMLSIVALKLKHVSLLSALQIVYSVFVDESESHENLLTRCVAYILQYRNSREVINASFSLYNLDFLRFIYECCSEDPKVYEPLIEVLQKMKIVDLRYEMNMYIKDYSSAAKYLVRSVTKSPNVILDIISKFSMQEAAYEAITEDSPLYLIISKSYAQHLSMAGKHEEAGVVCEKADLYKNAIGYYRLGCNWGKVIEMCTRGKVEDRARRSVLRQLVNALIERKKIKHAALLLVQNLDERENAVKLFVEHKMFVRAIFAAKAGCPNLIETLIKPNLEEYANIIIEKTKELYSKFRSDTDRILILRKEKLTKLERRYDDDTHDEDDTHSEYGSLISRSSTGVGSADSKSSSMSSRNRRKQEKKKIDTRQGGQFEDIALIRQLHMQVTEIFGLSTEVKEICMAVKLSLVCEDPHLACIYELFELAKEGQRLLEKVHGKVYEAIPDIWSETFIKGSDITDLGVLAVIENRGEIDPEYIEPPKEDYKDWKVQEFC